MPTLPNLTNDELFEVVRLLLEKQPAQLSVLLTVASELRRRGLTATEDVLLRAAYAAK
jgi:hypothetical protein